MGSMKNVKSLLDFDGFAEPSLVPIFESRVHCRTIHEVIQGCFWPVFRIHGTLFHAIGSSLETEAS